ncbi:fimbrial biogenesis chaperone [Serratia aquatilis]|uniref:Molecular chaperone n=1 Tax=Serratia aquatilis TaxID=1737515 RepID=A0ABV6EH84_9GAMM
MPRFLRLLSAVLPLMVMPMAGQASGFGIDATRLIYPQGAGSISVTLRNTLTTTPYLVQTAISRTPAGTEPVPFIATPPLFRLEPASINQVRITYRQSAPLPRDRESVFYFRASAIPASHAPDTDQSAGRVKGAAQFGVGNIIKLFYRPSTLAGSALMAQKGLQFSRVGEGVRVNNPSPYFISFASLSVGGKKLPLNTPEALMIAPFGTHTFVAKELHGKVKWETIGDEGGIRAFSHDLP